MAVRISDRSDAEIVAICRTGIPGYDPWRDAGDLYRFDVERARDVLCFFERELTFIEGERAGTPFLLEAWQAAIVGNVFGWVTTDDDPRRRYREVFVMVGRKNGKSPLAAGVALFCLLFDGEQGAQVYSAAADRDQAAIIYRHAAEMVTRNPRLDPLCRRYRTTKAIEVAETASIFRSLSSDADTKHGLGVHAAIVDELHAHKNRDLVDTLTSGRGARRQPLIFDITTADYERISICNELHDHARKVRDGATKDARFLPVVYEAGPKDDWKDPATWAKANPNLGVSVRLEDMVEECEAAQNRPAKLNSFLRLRLNIRTGSHTALFPMAKWDASAGSVDWKALREKMRGKTCYAGIDLASRNDIAGFALWFPEEGVVLPFGFVPRERATEREKTDRVPYAAWERDGAIEFTEGDTIDYGTIRRRFNEAREAYDLKTSNYDRFDATSLVNDLVGDGADLAGMGQGFVSMNAPTKDLERRVFAGKIVHGGHPVLRWMAGHFMIEKDAADNWKPSKRRSSEKIDLIAATIMAIAASMVAKPDEYIHPTAFSTAEQAPAAAASGSSVAVANSASVAIAEPPPAPNPFERNEDNADLWS